MEGVRRIAVTPAFGAWGLRPHDDGATIRRHDVPDGWRLRRLPHKGPPSSQRHTKKSSVSLFRRTATRSCQRRPAGRRRRQPRKPPIFNPTLCSLGASWFFVLCAEGATEKRRVVVSSSRRPSAERTREHYRSVRVKVARRKQRRECRHSSHDSSRHGFSSRYLRATGLCHTGRLLQS